MTKYCKVCEAQNPNPLEKTCGYQCRSKWLLSQDGEKEIAKALRKAERERKRAERQAAKIKNAKTAMAKLHAKGLSHSRELTQVAFNKMIRARDYGKGCISCGSREYLYTNNDLGGDWDCGHYKTVGAYPELRYEPKNANGQCKDCNGSQSNKSGNVVEQRKGIVDRYGQERLDWLDGPHEARHYTIEELAEMRKEFNRIARELERTQKLSVMTAKRGD